MTIGQNAPAKMAVQIGDTSLRVEAWSPDEMTIGFASGISASSTWLVKIKRENAVQLHKALEMFLGMKV